MESPKYAKGFTSYRSNYNPVPPNKYKCTLFTPHQMESDFNLDLFMQQMKAASLTQDETPQRKRIEYSSKAVEAKDIAVAYVVHNADGSFTQLKMHKTEIKAVWTTVIAETEKNKNSVTDMRLAALNDWQDPNARKREVYAQGVAVQPNECLCKCLKRNPIDNPVLLVVWETNPSTPAPSVSCKRKDCNIVLFTNGTDTTKSGGGPVVLVHTASGIEQLDEPGIQTIASSAFIEWLQNKVEGEGWKVISLLPMAASVRVKKNGAGKKKHHH